MPAESTKTAVKDVAEESLEVDAAPQVRRRKGGPRSRSGCLTCRNRKKKCDGAFPVCEQCRRLNYSCLREEPRSHIPANAHTWKTPPRSITKPSDEVVIACQSPLAHSLDASGIHTDIHASTQLASHRKETMRHYIQVFSVMLTTNLENNCFLSVFLPMAMDNPTLLNAVLAWSSSHMSLQDEKYEQTALQFRGISLKTLSNTLSSQIGQEPDLETSLASCLVLCSMEIIIGDTTQWFQHLAGAYEVIKSVSATPVGQDKSPLIPTGFLASWDGRWLLRNFAYHDILMSVTCDRKPFLPGFYWQNEDESIPDSYFGLASRLIYLISEISVLHADMKELRPFVNVHNNPTTAHLDPSRVAAFFNEEFFIPNMATASTFSTRAHKLETQLLEWQCESSPNPSLVGLAEGYRAAALIHLYRILRKQLPDLSHTLDYKISQVVQTMMEILETLPQGCLPECTLLFPLFMAGGEARGADEVNIIRRRLVDILESRHFKNHDIAIQVLDEVWAARSMVVASDGDSDWCEILKRKNWKLALT